MRLIDADAIKYHEYLEPMGNGMYVHGGIVDDKEIDAMPTVDAVPVIRCKECIYKQGRECTRFAGIPIYDEDYCSKGERDD